MRQLLRLFTVSTLAGERHAVVVDDEIFVRMEMADALSLCGWKVSEFGTAEAALAYLSKRERVDLLVTDIRLPGPRDGWDLALAYREQNESMAVIYCSANPQLSTKQVPRSIFLEKPCKMARLLAAAKALREQNV